LLAAAATGRAVNVKKGQFLAPQDMRHAIAKITSAGNERVILTERGASYGYHNLVVDMRAFPIMRGFGYPVVFDVTHSLQLPGPATASRPDRPSSSTRSRPPAWRRASTACSWKSTKTREGEERRAERARARPPRRPAGLLTRIDAARRDAS